MKVRAQPYESKLLPLRGLTPDMFWRVKRKITMLLTRGGPAWRSRRFGERVPSRELHLIDHVILILTSLPMLANPMQKEYL